LNFDWVPYCNQASAVCCLCLWLSF
jgi:hypothetical protein